MKLTDLKRSKSEMQGENPTGAAADPYPYGTRISLGEEELGKLGMKDLPKVGQKMHVRAHAVVHSASSEERAGGKKHRRLELQIHKIALEKRGASDAGSMQEAVDNGIDEADEE